MESALNFTNKVNKLFQEMKYYRTELQRMRNTKYGIGNIIGKSEEIQKVKEQIINAGRTNSTILIEGETGTGKEIVAHTIHEQSRRKENPFIRVNCAAIPSELMESELFGYEEGSFTGAKKGGKQGKFEIAESGSLFLDEINQLPLNMQPKLLRVLQEHEIERIGGRESIPIDVRIISASNVSLEKMVEDNKFREDLFYRLNVIKIQLPPLRERKKDIPLLVNHFVDKLNVQLNMSVTSVGEDVMHMLTEYNWPGNIRELQNVLECAMNNTRDEKLEFKHFEHLSKLIKCKVPYSGPNLIHKNLKKATEAIEIQLILKMLKECSGNKAAVARRLNISRTVLYRKLKKYNIS